MTSVRKLLFAAAIGIGTLAPEWVAMGAPIFEGHMGSGKETLFVISEDGVSSDYLKLGQTFRGYMIIAFDKERELLTVAKDHKATLLSLKNARVVGAPPRVVLIKTVIDANGDVELDGRRMSIDAFCEHVLSVAGVKKSTQFAMFFKTRKNEEGKLGAVNESINRIRAAARSAGFASWLLMIDEPSSTE